MNKIIKPDKYFTQISNSVLNNNKISMKAKGIYCYLVSKPDDYEFSATRIADEIKEGRGAVLSMIKELEDADYLYRLKRQDGRIDYYFFNFPSEKKAFLEKNAKSHSPTVPQSDSRTLAPLNNKEYNKQILNNKKKEGEKEENTQNFENSKPQNEIKNLTQSLDNYCVKIGLTADEELAWKIKRTINSKQNPQGFLDYLNNYRSNQDDFDEKKLKFIFYQDYWYNDFLAWEVENREYLRTIKDYIPQTEEDYLNNIKNLLNNPFLNKYTS
jgi:DNA-binding MarR family transcriptional regulator